MDGLSDRGSIPLSSTNDGKNSRNSGERVPAVFVFECFLDMVFSRKGLSVKKFDKFSLTKSIQ